LSCGQVTFIQFKANQWFLSVKFFKGEKMKNLVLISLFLIFICFESLLPQIPRLISYQGVLTDTTGKPKPDGIYNFVFSFYETSTAGNLLWTESKQLDVLNGLFLTQLGDVTSISSSLTFDRQYWLGVKVGTDPELIPRIKLTSSPYSLHSIYADTALNAYGIKRPITPPVSSYEIAPNTVIRYARVFNYKRNLDTVVHDSITIVSRNDIDIYFENDSLIIGRTSGSGNTLDQAYDEGANPGDGRIINATDGSVEIKGDDGLLVTGTNRIIEARTVNLVPAILVESSKGPALYSIVNQNGTSSSGIFAQFNGKADEPNVNILTAGTHSGIQSLVTTDFRGLGGTANAGIFSINNTFSKSTSLYASTDGLANAGEFQILNSLNNSYAIYAKSIGTAGGGRFIIENDQSKAFTIWSVTDGIGGAGNFSINNQNNTNATIQSATDGLGMSGKFEATNTANDKYALYAKNYGKGYGLYGESGGSPSGFLGFSGTAGLSKENWGIMGWSEKKDGVFGTMQSGGNFNLGPARIIAGVHGNSAGNIGGSADNFGVAGIGSGYGSGVLGIGAGELGHGIIGVSGTGGPNKTSTAVRGITREDSLGNRINWPPMYPLDESFPGKDIVGVLGEAVNTVGVWGESYRKIGVVGTQGKRTGTGDINLHKAGVLGLAYSTNAPGVQGISFGGGAFGVRAEAHGLNSMGVYATSDSGSAGMFKIENINNNFVGLWVETKGLEDAAYFLTSNQNNSRPTVYVQNDGLGDAGYFKNNKSTNTRPVLYTENLGTGEAGYFTVTNSLGTKPTIFGTHHGTNRAGEFDILNAGNSQPALYAYTLGTNYAGYFQNNNASSTNPAVYVISNSTGYAFISNSIAAGTKKAGYFGGNVQVTGTLFKGGGGFRIDHPLDPTNKFLNHSFVESPDMKNIYDGNVYLDSLGQAIVQLPNWFVSVNSDYRYQLTPIGGFAPIYISQEVINNQFRIAGGTPGLKVSWQVTGIRNDRWAVANRIQVEENKVGNESQHYHRHLNRMK
jgi:hypothetical protein